jgi:hypothetical protein
MTDPLLLIIHGHAVAQCPDVSITNNFDRTLRPPWVPEPEVVSQSWSLARCEFTETADAIAAFLGERFPVVVSVTFNGEECRTFQNVYVVGYSRNGAKLTDVELQGPGFSLRATTEPRKLDGALSALPTVEHPGFAAGPWIAVTDRLPPCAEEVLAVRADGRCGVAYTDERGASWMWRGAIARDVTHWAELHPPETDAKGTPRSESRERSARRSWRKEE